MDMYTCSCFLYCMTALQTPRNSLIFQYSFPRCGYWVTWRSFSVLSSFKSSIWHTWEKRILSSSLQWGTILMQCVQRHISNRLHVKHQQFRYFSYTSLSRCCKAVMVFLIHDTMFFIYPPPHWLNLFLTHPQLHWRKKVYQLIQFLNIYVYLSKKYSRIARFLLLPSVNKLP